MGLSLLLVLIFLIFIIILVCIVNVINFIIIIIKEGRLKFEVLFFYNIVYIIIIL